MVPPGGLHFTALSNRLVTARSRSSASPTTYSGFSSTSKIRPLARRRTRSRAALTTSRRSIGSGAAVTRSSRVRWTRSPIKVVNSANCADTSARIAARSVGAQQPGALVGGQQFDVGTQAGQRSPQLVAGVGDEPLLTYPGGGQRAQHPVERVGQSRHVVAAAHHDGVEVLGQGDVLDRGGELAHRAQTRAGDGVAGDGGQHHAGGPEEDQHQPERGQGVVDHLQRSADHQRGVAESGQRHGHDAVLTAVGRDSRNGPTAAPGAGPPPAPAGRARDGPARPGPTAPGRRRGSPTG